MTNLGSLSRIGLALALLSLSILLTGDLFIGTRGNSTQLFLESRRAICESLAVQFSSLVAVDDMRTVEATMRNLVKREGNIVSTALRTRDGRIRAQAGNHDLHWNFEDASDSSITHAQVPIIRNKERWGTVEIRFQDVQKDWLDNLTTPFTLLAVYVFFAGFVGYTIFMRRTLKHLDPGAVIPDRVKGALDVLTEGIVLIDDSGNIVLVNKAISKRIGISDDKLLGRKLTSLDWAFPDAPGAQQIMPWLVTLDEGKDVLDTRLLLEGDESTRTFTVNSSVIPDEHGSAQGALVTFDDVTELESKNSKLSELVSELRKSRNIVAAKNEELQILAERDPLTNLFNRRAFFDRLEIEMEEAGAIGDDLCVIMLDIDHFKSINDTYGHAAGDQLIRALAEIINSLLRSGEVAGRYGGEEFCILIPNADAAVGEKIGERLRKKIEEDARNAIPEHAGRVTTSVGVASLAGGADDARRLVDQADQALYASKESGRNRVTRWDLI